MREVAVSVGVGSAATVAVVCDVKVYDWVAWTGCVAKVPYYFEIPPFFPFTRGYPILTFDGISCRAEDECELVQPGVTWFDIVMSKHYRHNLRRHLIKLHPRNDQITVVRAVQCRRLQTSEMSFLHCDDDNDPYQKIDRRVCQAKQPRIQACCGSKW